MLFKEGEVFYNKAQVFNRDLSVAVLNAYAESRKADWDARTAQRRARRAAAAAERLAAASSAAPSVASGDGAPAESKDGAGGDEEIPFPGISILEALSATGLRSVRYAHEVRLVSSIVANDMDPGAVEAIRRNVEHNRVSHLVRPNEGDAMAVMYAARGMADRFDVIDLDPYISSLPVCLPRPGSERG